MEHVQPKERKQAGARKWTEERVRELFASRGLTLLETGPHLRARTKMEYRCRCGVEPCYTKVDSLLRGEDNCKICWLKKREATNFEKFGATHAQKGPAFQEKVRERRQLKAEEHKAAAEVRAVDKKRKREEGHLAKIATMGPEYHAEVAKITTKKQKTEDKGWQDESLPPQAMVSKRPRIVGAPRWPEPRPERSYYPDLSYKEWDKLLHAWRNSQPHSCAMRALYDKSGKGKMVRQQWYIKNKRKRVIYTTSLRAKALKIRRKRLAVLLNKVRPLSAQAKVKHAAYAKTPKRKAKMQQYYKLVKCAVNSLREQVSVDGHCSYRDPKTGNHSCKIRAKECDIHHLDANTLLPDGLRRKQAGFAQIVGLRALRREILRNTNEAGLLLLEALCPRHHARESFRGGYKRTQGEAEHRWKTVADIKLEIGRCQYEECEFQDELCSTREDTPMFHFDHLFTVHDQEVPENMQKVEAISQMIRQVGVYSLADIKREIGKCRLVHALCHRRITTAQRAQGRIQSRPPR